MCSKSVQQYFKSVLVSFKKQRSIKCLGMLNSLGVAFSTNYTHICFVDLVEKIKVLETLTVKVNYLLGYKVYCSLYGYFSVLYPSLHKWKTVMIGLLAPLYSLFMLF